MQDPVSSKAIPEPSTPSVYELIREDIIAGRLPANERLKVADLAKRHGTSSNPVREALQQLRGEGIVILTPNRGARVRAIDEEFVRNICEMEMLIEPYLISWFVGTVTDTDIEHLRHIQGQIEAVDFQDPHSNSDLDTQFHQYMYQQHYNRHAVDMWWKHREILAAIARRYPLSLARRKAILSEHQELLKALQAQDADKAATVLRTHVEGSGKHIIEQLRTARLRGS